MILYRCTNGRCPLHPCFLRCDKTADSDCYGDFSPMPPDTCPCLNVNEETVNCKFELCERNESASRSGCASLEEWMDGDGYDRFTDEERDEICAIEPYGAFGNERIDSTRLAQILNILDEFDANPYEQTEIMERITKLAKKSPANFIAALFQSGFRAGAIWMRKREVERNGERDEREEREEQDELDEQEEQEQQEQQENDE